MYAVQNNGYHRCYSRPCIVMAIGCTCLQAILLQLHQCKGIHLRLTKLLTVMQACLPCAYGKDTTRNPGPTWKHYAYLHWKVLTVDIMGPLSAYQDN